MNILEPFGPSYPALPSVAKYRRHALAAGSLAACDKHVRHEYGAAVESAIRALQRLELRREVASIPANCASGTWYSAGADIHKAVRAKQAAKLAAAAGQIRRKRLPCEWESLYAEAMKAKHDSRDANRQK